MDDLLGEDWQSPPQQSNARPLNPTTIASNLSSLRASPQIPISNTASPFNLSRPSSAAPGIAAARSPIGAQKPAGDAFGNLTGLKSSAKSTGSGLSIQERQKQLVEERNRQLQEQGQLWDKLGGQSDAQSKQGQQNGADEDVDDILAAFKRDVKVDKSSHFPPPSLPASQPVSGRGTPAVQPGGQAFDDVDDDTFGLNELKVRANGQAKTKAARMVDNDDDILGDLGRPVAGKPKTVQPTASPDDSDDGWDENVARSRSHQPAQPKSKALSELIEMGFPEETAQIALAENGGDVQGSVGWLLQQAHEESRQKAKESQQGRTESHVRNGSSPARASRADRGAMPSWMQDETRSASASRRQQSEQAAGEKDAGQMAQEIGSKLFKSANSLWKAGQKQMAKTIADFQQERDPAQPKWMQSAEHSEQSSRDSSQRRTARPVREDASVTNEAALLDMPRENGQGRPSQAAQRQPRQPERNDLREEVLRRRPAGDTSRASSTASATDRRPAAKLSRQDVEEQSAQAYISPARRKRTPKPEVQKAPEPEVDLFSPAPAAAAPKKVEPKPAVVRPAAPKRDIPPVSASALASSANHRKTGGDAFKRGDYGAAHEAYTASLTPLPSTHPIVIIILSNRSLTALKTGDAKTAVSDADRALELIGPSQGSGETINVEGADKDMKEFFGKALMRKAEALEHMEKWSEAATVWRQAVEAGVGGAISIRGKQRCEKAATPAPAKAPSTAPKAVAAVKPKPAKSLGNSVQRPTLATPSSGDAVKKLREANAAAEKADDEKFRLSDQVDAKLTAWKGGKADNLRALLQSMDTVLWQEAGWKKVGMSDLVVPGKVKIVYMKAIAKVHPDKIAQNATTEQRMISAAVFSTLNEAWDKFKKDNNL